MSRCFMGAGGARIRAARGDVPVETIAPGDEVAVVRDGIEVLEPVKWVGSLQVDPTRHSRPEDVAPIRIRKDAIAEGQPNADLWLSPEHCLIIDGRCMPVKYLVNGASIVSERNHPPLTYYHLELERHGILLANNTFAESYLDTGNRDAFDDGEGVRQLYPTLEVNPGSDRWLTAACAPLARVPDEVEPVWRKLAERSEEIGWPVPEPRTVDRPELHVVADGFVIRPQSDNDGRYVFAVPAGVKSVSLVSRFCIPADRMIPELRDTRRLGVCVRWIAIRSGDEQTVLAADDPSLRDGWNAAETDGQAVWRWTDGSATIPWENVPGPAVLSVRCVPVEQYPVYDQYAQLVA
ncbi:MAG TPA: Hint domain-containing protein [Acetobacteraceae bacterium]|nr:Hint domain-containing protein [Acetobacteraceae bacterium]